jgi:TIR domain
MTGKPSPPKNYSSSIFINYRREDTLPYAGRLSDELARHFPDCKIFMDIDAIGYGVNFGAEIDKAVTSCNVLIVLIGRQWLRITDEKGQRRLDNPDDWVRLEIGKALKGGIRVIPILLQGAAMPSAEALPADIRELANLNALEIGDVRWRHDIPLLIDTINEILLERTDPPPTESISSAALLNRSQARRRLQIPTPAKIFLAITLAAAVLFLIIWKGGRGDPGTNVNNASPGNSNATTQTTPTESATHLQTASELSLTTPAPTATPSESALTSNTPAPTPVLQSSASPAEAPTPSVMQIIDGSNVGPRLPRSAMDSELSKIGTSCRWSVNENGGVVCTFSYAYRKLPTVWSATFKDDKLEKLVATTSFDWRTTESGHPDSLKESKNGNKGEVDRYCGADVHEDFISSLVSRFGAPISKPEKSVRDLSRESSNELCTKQVRWIACRSLQTLTNEQYIFRFSGGRLLRFTWDHSSGSIMSDTERKTFHTNWTRCLYSQSFTAE